MLREHGAAISSKRDIRARDAIERDTCVCLGARVPSHVGSVTSCSLMRGRSYARPPGNPLVTIIPCRPASSRVPKKQKNGTESREFCS